MRWYELDFEQVYHHRVVADGKSLQIGSLDLHVLDDLLIFEDSIGKFESAFFFAEASSRHQWTTSQPQLAAYLFAITRKPRLMNHYFPLTRSLERGQEAEFHKLIVSIANHPGFDLRLYGELHRVDPSPVVGVNRAVALAFAGRLESLQSQLSEITGRHAAERASTSASMQGLAQRIDGLEERMTEGLARLSEGILRVAESIGSAATLQRRIAALEAQIPKPKK